MTVNPRGDRPIKQERSDRIKRYLEISAALAAIVGLVAAVYFPIRGEKHKAVELRYLAKLSLVSPEATTSGKVKVAYDNRVVENPTKLSARLGNSGDLPIEAKDIEQPLVLLFEGVRILNAEITERSPGDIRAAVQYTDKTVTLEHGLLNPGDYLLFEILSDGDKGWPKPQVRIAGISKLLLTFPTTQSRRDKVLFLDLQRHWQYAVLGIASVVPVAALVVFLLASWDSIRIGVSPPDIRTEIDTAFNKDEIASDCFMNGYDSKKADSQLFGLVSDFASLDDPTALADVSVLQASAVDTFRAGVRPKYGIRSPLHSESGGSSVGCCRSSRRHGPPTAGGVGPADDVFHSSGVWHGAGASLRRRLATATRRGGLASGRP